MSKLYILLITLSLLKWSYIRWICAYHHAMYELDSQAWSGLLDTTLCDNVCQWLTIVRLISPGILAPVLCSKWQSLQGRI